MNFVNILSKQANTHAQAKMNDSRGGGGWKKKLVYLIA